jgi:hypothetical protein
MDLNSIQQLKKGIDTSLILKWFRFLSWLLSDATGIGTMQRRRRDRQ